MLDRQDIDALLIGRLYGELSDADEARLNAHLDSHPADKSALVGLTSARNAVRESRFLTVQIEPPQAISALLLQEASRRAPARVIAQEQDVAKKESWFARFVGSFARHPAMAAAAMMVLVCGVAGTMYLRDGKSQFADQSTQTFGGASEKLAKESPAPAAAPALEADRNGAVEEAKALQQQAGSSFEASLADGAATGAGTDKKESNEVAAVRREQKDKEVVKADPAVAAKPPTNRTYIGVQSERAPQPKELENAPDVTIAGDGDSDARRRAKGGAAAPGAADNQRREPVVATPSPPPPPRAPAASVPRGAGAVANGEDALKQEKPADEETSWAREQVVKVGNAVKANNCKDAASLAVQLFTRNPAFYKDSVENDRELKKCITYINAAREKEAEQQRAKNLKRNADEPRRAAPTTNNK